jgi:hypothetical protein
MCDGGVNIQEVVTPGEYLVIQCTDKVGFSETEVMGPFPTEAAARKAMRKDVPTPDVRAHELTEGKSRTWGSKYIIVKVEKTLQPVPDVKVKLGWEKAEHVAYEYEEREE